MRGSRRASGGIEGKGNAGLLRKNAGASKRDSWMDPVSLMQTASGFSGEIELVISRPTISLMPQD